MSVWPPSCFPSIRLFISHLSHHHPPPRTHPLFSVRDVTSRIVEDLDHAVQDGEAAEEWVVRAASFLHLSTDGADKKKSVRYVWWFDLFLFCFFFFENRSLIAFSMDR